MPSAAALPADLAPSQPAFSLVPWPASLQAGSGVFTLDAQTRLCCEPKAALADLAAYLRETLAPATGLALPSATPRELRRGKVIHLTLKSSRGAALGAEGYELEATPAGVTLRAHRPAGLFNAIQTLRQLLPPEIFSPLRITRTAWSLPAVTIVDQPRYAWRGLMLDVGRHYFDVATLHRFIDQMALHKLNVLHLHLTEDQGWRMEIRKHPRLARLGSARASSPRFGRRDLSDGLPYGPLFYTQEELRGLVAYAARRQIVIVPEIEMPGHCQAALAVYPQLSCSGGPFPVSCRWGVHEEVYCAGKEATFTFLKEVLDEVLEIFPSPFIHIGGDECPKARWRACPACQARMRKEGIQDEHALQSWFIRRIERHLAARGRRLIGWDEILEGGLSDGATVMSWRGTAGGIAAARQGHDVVLTPNSHCYFDYYQAEDPATEPETIGGFLPLAKVYDFDPALPELSAEEQRHILGIQGNVWTEYISTPRKLDYMTYPRAAALAERAWSPANMRHYTHFLGRLQAHAARLDLLGVWARPGA